MYEVRVTAEARVQFDRLPLSVRSRVLVVYHRLGSWPNVSGAKPLRHDLKGRFRIRTGDYRILFTVNSATNTITVLKIAHRKDVYE